MPRKSGLGRGLDALLPSARPTEEGALSGVREVPPEMIDPNPRQPRQEFAEESLSELAASITQLGILQPLLIREKGDGRFELIAGERRLRAARLAGVEAVPVLIVETDDRGSLERALVENVHREDLTPLEEAAAYKQLIDEGGLTQEQLGARLGRSQPAISNTMRLMELPLSIQALLTERRIAGGHARALLGLQGHPMQERAARSVVADELTVRQTEALVSRYLEKFAGGTAKKMGRPRETSPAALEAERRLGTRLQTKVRVEASKRKRRIIIDAASDEDLQRVVDVILGEQVGGTLHTVSIDQRDSS